MNHKVYLLQKKLRSVEFIRYFLVGVVATLVDWGSFYLLAVGINIYYQFSLVVSVSLGATTNYILNKLFTFRCKSKKVVSQFSVFAAIAGASLLMAVLVMFVLVDLLSIDKMVSRVLTTFIMLVVNYFMHKYVTFNKRFFR